MKLDTFQVPMLEKFSWDAEKEYKRSSKIERIMEKLDEVLTRDSHSKVVIFCHFLQMMELLGQDMAFHSINHVKMTGSLSTNQRKEVIKKFTNDKRIRVFMISIQAGGVGLNLTCANVVFIVEPWWNLAVE